MKKETTRSKLHYGVDMESLGLPPADTFNHLKLTDQQKSLIIFLEKLDKKGIHIQKKLYEVLSTASLEGVKKSPSEINVDSLTFELLSPLSQKKVVVVQLNNYFAQKYNKEILGTNKEKEISLKEYQKQEIKHLYKLLRKVRGIEVAEAIDYFVKVGMHDIIKAFMHSFIRQELNPLEEIYERINDYTDNQEFEAMKEIAINHGVKKSIIDKLFYNISKNKSDVVGKNDSIELVTEKLESELMDTEEVNTSGMLDFNPHLEDLNMEIGFKFFGENKTRAIYKEKFFSIYDSLAEEGTIQKPAGYDIYYFYINKLLGSEIQDNPKVFQHITHWEVPKDFEENDMLELGNLIKTIVTDFNVKLMPYKKYHKNYMNLSEGESEYIGFFKANSSFANENLILYKEVKSGKRYLTLSLGHTIAQDMFIYFNTQISYFLKNKKFIDKTQLYADMYHRYNLMKLEATEIFDISMMNQYKDIIKDIIWPLSLEYTRKHGEIGKPKNSLLVGVYGTSKSQTMLSLMKNKEFEFNDKKFTLNANVISFSTMDFVRLLKDDVSIKKRLADIYENTQIPIILLLEDIDTTTEDVMIEQAMTILMDGIGSIPITIVSAVNYPEKIPHRLIRPNRLENIILYNVPLGENIVSGVMETHIKKQKLDKYLDTNILKELVSQMEYWTPSHIGAFIKRIREYIDFESNFDENFVISKKDIEDIIKKLPVPIGDIKQKQKDIDNWYSKATNGDKSKIGF